MLWGVVIAIVSGTLMSVQGVWNTEVTKQTSVWISASFVQATALLVCFCAWLISGREGHFSDILSVSPKYLLLGGVLGAFITYTVIVAVNRLDPARATIYIVVAQVLISYLIELLGLFGIEKAQLEWRKLIGVLTIAGGLVIFKWKS